MLELSLLLAYPGCMTAFSNYWIINSCYSSKRMTWAQLSSARLSGAPRPHPEPGPNHPRRRQLSESEHYRVRPRDLPDDAVRWLVRHGFYFVDSDVRGLRSERCSVA